MAKYHSGVAVGKCVKITNPNAKISPAQQKFAKWEVGLVKRYIKVK